MHAAPRHFLDRLAEEMYSWTTCSGPNGVSRARSLPCAPDALLSLAPCSRGWAGLSASAMLS